MKTVFITDGLPGEYVVTFSYDAKLVAMIKSLPAHTRAWSPASKEWTITGSNNIAYLVDLLRLDNVQVVDSRKASRAKASSGTGSGSKARASTSAKPAADWATAMFQQIPDDALRQKVFRALAKVLHPDTGGNAELFRQLNDAKDNRK